MPLHERTAPSGVPADANQAPAAENQVTGCGKTKVIGLYGISGSGKTYLLDHLKKELDKTCFIFFEGSEVIDSLVPSGLEGFRKLDAHDQTHWRQLAIDSLRAQCTRSGKIGIVAGHFMFWSEAQEEGHTIYTQNDMATYTHIVYVDVPTEVLEQRRRDDTERSRPPMSANHLRKWQESEKTQLLSLCRKHGILFSLLASDSKSPSRLVGLIKDFSLHTEDYNALQARAKLDEALVSSQGRLETVLVLDADRTLAATDTGAMFWKQIADSCQETSEESPLKSLFGGPLGYSYEAFRQAMLLYEDAVDEEEYENLCQRIASAVTMYPELVSLLRLVAEQDHVGALVVSCGLRRVWDKVFEREGLAETVSVIAGGRIADGLVVTAAVKKMIVTRLRDFHQVYVWAFGDSPLDLDMMKAADQAIVVVGDQLTRSKSMDTALSEAIRQGRLRASQVLLPDGVSHRLNTTELPVVSIAGIEFISALLRRHSRSSNLPMYISTQTSAAKLLATPMRNSSIAGPALREAHCQAGWYLACHFLTRIIGLEECPIAHVLGHKTTGYRLLHEERTSIVALMRAGEPMASGVSKAYPSAMYVHASQPGDLKPHHVQGQIQIILVDSVINSGKTILEFAQTIRNLDKNIRIALVAGVVQAECISPSSTAYKALSGHGNISLTALRLSDTKFVGSKTTDTGNRLFNTTHLL